MPASAVTDGTVQVVSDGRATRTPVTTGVTGATTVEVTSGLAAGDVVVLADLGAALPTSDQPTGPQGGFVVGGPGGFTGGPPTQLGR